MNVVHSEQSGNEAMRTALIDKSVVGMRPGNETYFGLCFLSVEPHLPYKTGLYLILWSGWTYGASTGTLQL